MATTHKSSKWLTAPELARRWGVAHDKVLTFIRNGELQAVDLCSKRGGRPRWHISPEAVEAFERARSAQPRPTTSPRRRPKRDDGVIEFFK